MPACEFVLLLGSNLSERIDHLERAKEALASHSEISVVQSSSIYESAAVDMPEGAPDFLNQALLIRTTLSPLDLLHQTQKIERDLGRNADDKGKLLPRTIDIDILLCGGTVVSNPELQIPHPRLNSRAFALGPLLELLPNAIDPGNAKPLAEFFSKELQRQIRKLS